MRCPLCNSASNKYANLYDDRYSYPGRFWINKCRSCGHLFLNNKFSNRQIIDLYTNYYPREKLSIPSKSSINKIHPIIAWWHGFNNKAHHFVQAGSKKVLDIGCGMGESLLELEQQGNEAHGIDADNNFKLSIKRNNLRGRVGLFSSRLYPKKYFDVVVMDQLIEHVEHPVNFMKEVSEVLNEDGEVVIATPNFNSLNRWLYRENSFLWHVPYHLQFFTKKSIAKLAQESGFVIKKSFTKTRADWLFYQQAHLLLKPKKGERSSFFYPWQENRSFKEKVMITIIFAYHLLGINHFFARVLDLLGLGSNSIYVLKKSDHIRDLCKPQLGRSFPLAPYWSSELYSRGRYFREYGFYPSFLPLCINSSHGIGEFTSPLKYELATDAPLQVFFSENAYLRWKNLTDKPATQVLAPEIFYRKKNKIEPDSEAKGTIFFPVHSTPNFVDLIDHQQIVKAIKELPKKYHPVSLCLHAHDVNKGLHKKYLELGVSVVTAGHTGDYRFISRFYRLLRSHRYAMSNGIGSYLFYSIEMGIPFSIIGPKPKLKNISDVNFKKGKIKNDEHLPEFIRAVSMFEGLHNHITEEQRLLVESKLGVGSQLSRLSFSWLLYLSFIKWTISPKKLWNWAITSYRLVRNKFL